MINHAMYIYICGDIASKEWWDGPDPTYNQLDRGHLRTGSEFIAIRLI